ncbi:hypothetical protein FOL47_006295 [Perkinsus chesapeaki]|uniref:beta-N-acetylhexosaminidase n=1 Tax=Perkinsus chesapeaki TaxID=330153 RepID=A0A7J6MZV5_PERCH|nr:hypothetical protein FOL47_006295 [Perkinsus chesapeaki]
MTTLTRYTRPITVLRPYLWNVSRRYFSTRPWTTEEDTRLVQICGDTMKALPAWVATTSVSQLIDRSLRRASRGEAILEGRSSEELLGRIRDLGLESRDSDRRWLSCLKRRLSQLNRETAVDADFDPDHVATTLLAPVGKKAPESPSLSPLAFCYFLQICCLQPRLSRIMMDRVIQHLHLTDSSFSGDFRAAKFFHNQAVAIVREQADAIADAYVNFKRELKINVVLQDVLTSTSEVRFLLDMGQGRYSSSHYLDDSRMWSYARGDVFLIGKAHPDQLTTLDFTDSCSQAYKADTEYLAYPRLRIHTNTPLQQQTITVNCAACGQSELKVNAGEHLKGATRLKCKCQSSGRRPHPQPPVQFPTDELWLGKVTRVAQSGSLGELRLKVFPASSGALAELLSSDGEDARVATTPVSVFKAALDDGRVDWLCAPVTANIPQITSRVLSAVFALCANDPTRQSPFVRRLLLEGHPQAAEERIAWIPEPSNEDLRTLAESQKSAVRAAVASRCTLIQGPPGTGKTFAVVAIVKHWLRTNPEFPIMVCAGTHAARALLHTQLEAEGITVTAVPAYIGDYGETTRRRMERDTTKPGTVYVETVYSAALVADRKLTRVIVDEASQLTVAGTLLPIMQGAEQVVLLGDDRQLSAVSGGLSLFDELLASELIAPKFLSEQFRMHPEVAAFSSRHFYDDQLTCHPSWRSKAWPALPLPDIFHSRVASDNGDRVIFVDTGGATREAFDKGCDSYYNAQEADAVALMVDSLLASGARDADVGVVTPYAAQRTYIRRQLHLLSANIVEGAYADRISRRSMTSKSGPDPTIDSVDAFQGSERSWIVFSAVRSNPELSVGFLNDYRRVNVMLTRARYGVVVIGDGETLHASRPWRAWLDWVQDHGKIIRLDKDALKEIAEIPTPHAKRVRFDPDRWRLGVALEAAYGKIQATRPLAEACIWSATSEFNTVEVQLDDRTGNVIQCLCTCPDGRSNHGRCHHAAALTIRVRQQALGMSRQYAQTEFLPSRELPRTLDIKLELSGNSFDVINEQFDIYRLPSGEAEATAHGIQGAFGAIDAVCGQARRFALEATAPRSLAYRGLLLDISHVFLSVDDLKRIIEFISRQAGLNVLHLHITDHQCFGIELASAPELAHASQSACNRDGSVKGYYTKDELKDLGETSAVLGVQLLLEIDLPGHAGAWKASHPEHVTDDYLNPSDETMWKLLSTVLTELEEFSPDSPLRAELPLGLHLGGDEVSNRRAQREFETRLKNYKRKGSAWHDLRWEESLLVGGVERDDIVTVWKSFEMDGRILLEDVVSKGFKAINMCLSRLYLDAKFQPTVQAIRNFDAYRSGSQSAGPNGRLVDPSKEHLVLGAAVSCWGECMRDLANDSSGRKPYTEFWNLVREAGRNFWNAQRPSKRQHS